ncbi:MAG: hypothetical protein HRT71_05705 [Flavobacteriales bacterium]|nr:hypothetical protein [Flavobacteriales bacterium]
MSKLTYSAKLKNVPNRVFETSLDAQLTYMLAKGQLAASLREIDLKNLQSWEFSSFSQNGEDGIIEVLLKQVKETNRYFLEIGSADGIANCSAFLARVLQYSGIMVEGDDEPFEMLQRLIGRHSSLVEAVNQYVTTDNFPELLEKMPYKDPDVLIMDIDGMDLYMVKKLLELEYRPKILVVEYNSAFGPNRSITIPYQAEFNYLTAHPSQLYYGVSISAWRTLLTEKDYVFVGVESHGVNAFFIDKNSFDNGFFDQLNGATFEENRYQIRLHGNTWEKQFEKIKDMPFEEVT